MISTLDDINIQRVHVFRSRNAKAHYMENPENISRAPCNKIERDYENCSLVAPPVISFEYRQNSCPTSASALDDTYLYIQKCGGGRPSEFFFFEATFTISVRVIKVL